jgi:hypothetical protein
MQHPQVAGKVRAPSCGPAGWRCTHARLADVTAKPAPDEIVWWSGLRWVEAAHMQIRRFEEAFYEEVRALADAEMRHGLGDDSENSRSWRESYDAQEPYDPQRPAMGGQDALELLRNVAEHWDEVGGRSARELAEGHAGIEVGGIAYTGKELWIGGVDGCRSRESQPGWCGSGARWKRVSRTLAWRSPMI